MRHVQLRLLALLLTAITAAQPFLGPAQLAWAQGQKIEPQEVALRPSDLLPNFAVVKEESKPMDPGPGVLYAVTLERSINQEHVESGPVAVIQVIGRFDQSLSYEGFLDGLRRQAIDQDGFELVPGAPNDGGTASLQKFEGDVASFRVGFIKRDMVFFTGWVGRRGVVSLQGLLTLAGVSSQRYDDVLMARTGAPVPSQSGAPASPVTTPSSPPPGAGPAPRLGRVANTGGSGANVRALPQVNSDLRGVVHDGEEVDLVGAEEKGSDGRAWRNVKTGTGVVGWVVAEYVTTEAPAVAAAPAPPPPPPPTATAVPRAQAATRVAPTPTPQPMGSIDSRLTPALRALFAIRRGPSGGTAWGDWYRGVVDASGVNIVVGTLPSGVAGAYRFRTNTISVAQAILGEDTKTIAAIIAHELTHTAQAFRGNDPMSNCIPSEVESLQNEMIVWVILYDGLAPGRTRIERQQNFMLQLWAEQGDPVLYKLVVDTPGYQDQCRLWVP